MSDIVIFESFEDEKIKNLILTMQLIRLSKDVPLIWKLNDDYINSLKLYLYIEDSATLFQQTFLDAAIDITTRDPYCVAKLCIYPLLKK